MFTDNLEEASVWSENFSESNFSKIKIGMHETEAFKILGRPLNYYYDKKSCLLNYSRQKDSVSSYDLRDIHLDSYKYVISVIKEF